MPRGSHQWVLSHLMLNIPPSQLFPFSVAVSSLFTFIPLGQERGPSFHQVPNLQLFQCLAHSCLSSLWLLTSCFVFASAALGSQPYLHTLPSPYSRLSDLIILGGALAFMFFRSSPGDFMCCQSQEPLLCSL